MGITIRPVLNHRANASGLYDLFIRITQDRKHKLIKTGITISGKDQFNPKGNSDKKNWIRGRDVSAKRYNDELARKIMQLESDRSTLEGKERNPSKEALVQFNRGASAGDYMAHLQAVINRFKIAGQYRSAKRYGQLYNKLKEFESEKIPFDQLTVTFLKDFEGFLSGLHQNTRYEHFKNLKASLNQAIKEELFSSDKNPFHRFQITQAKTNKQKLSTEEIEKLKGLQLEKNTSLWNTLNAFLFAFNCGGIRAGDLLTMRWNNIEGNHLKYVMSKTRGSDLIERRIPLLPEAMAILKHYKVGTEKPGDFIFPLLDNGYSSLINADKKIKSGFEVELYDRIASRNTILNKNLKKIAVLVEITKPLTFHIARHSFAQFALSKQMPPIVLQSILGHQKFATTEKYLSGLDNKQVEEEMNRIFK